MLCSLAVVCGLSAGAVQRADFVTRRVPQVGEIQPAAFANSWWIFDRNSTIVESRLVPGISSLGTVGSEANGAVVATGCRLIVNGWRDREDAGWCKPEATTLVVYCAFGVT